MHFTVMCLYLAFTLSSTLQVRPPGEHREDSGHVLLDMMTAGDITGQMKDFKNNLITATTILVKMIMVKASRQV